MVFFPVIKKFILDKYAKHIMRVFEHFRDVRNLQIILELNRIKEPLPCVGFSPSNKYILWALLVSSYQNKF